MTKHTPDFSYLRGLSKGVPHSDLDRMLKRHEDGYCLTWSEEHYALEHAKNERARIAELEAELAAEKAEHLHTAMCFDKAWEKIEWLRSALKRQFWRAKGEREKVERLSDIIADLIAGGESAEQADPRLGYIELQTDRETLARAREALAATEPRDLTKPRNYGSIEVEGAKSD